MKLHATGRVQAGKFPVTVLFDETHADVLTFEFHSNPRGADWNIGRDLLAAGLIALAGEKVGDVRIWPSPDTDEVAIELHTPSGHAIIRLPWEPLATFVRRTYTRVPRSHEYNRIDWNAFPRPEISAGGAS